jgi:enediyne biosynthesis thioesterase
MPEAGPDRRTRLGRTGRDARGAWYEMRHVVGFEETNLVGNVYYVNLVRWQGRCRELFLRDHCPDLLAGLGRDLVLVTTSCSCEYLDELTAFDEVLVRMRLAWIRQGRVRMLFEYYRPAARTDSGLDPGPMVARGEQEIACMRRRDGRTEPIPVPPDLRQALESYSG